MKKDLSDNKEANSRKNSVSDVDLASRSRGEWGSPRKSVITNNKSIQRVHESQRRLENKTETTSQHKKIIDKTSDQINVDRGGVKFDRSQSVVVSSSEGVFGKSFDEILNISGVFDDLPNSDDQKSSNTKNESKESKKSTEKEQRKEEITDEPNKKQYDDSKGADKGDQHRKPPGPSSDSKKSESFKKQEALYQVFLRLVLILINDVENFSKIKHRPEFLNQREFSKILKDLIAVKNGKKAYQGLQILM
ncbi:hypothetical protein RF11_12817 [Thelohanellus kitauei]|uniref:Uncharacterized protein n=1 Tax=Thelohanellus kitauei TaxID=669202 RepID=A0A0C2I832_THEKT|nr:hypothetical protein RF11_12817 [Thelohanellus kitauei]